MTLRFKEFLMEDAELPNKPTSKSITFKNALKWAKTMAPNVMNNIKAGKVRIFRGVDGSKGDYQLGSTADFKRVSKNTRNYYMKFIATSKHWEKYPSRESAYVCATSPRIAEGYGRLFYVVPADDAKVGVVPSHDLWRGFPTVEQTLDLRGLNSLNDLLVEFMKAIDKKIVQENDIAGLRQAMRGWTIKALHDMAEDAYNFKGSKAPHWVARSAESAIEVMVKKGMSNFEQLLEYCLDPDVNNFSAMHAKDLIIPEKPGNEVWFEGNAIFIVKDAFQEFLEEYSK